MATVHPESPFPSLPIIVATVHPTETLEKRIDYCNPSDRKWLLNHLHWALHNSRTVAITAID